MKGPASYARWYREAISEHERTDEPSDRPTGDPTPYERFQSLTRRLLHVSKDELREAEAREQEKRRTA
jgi:hypothetical protein